MKEGRTMARPEDQDEIDLGEVGRFLYETYEPQEGYLIERQAFYREYVRWQKSVHDRDWAEWHKDEQAGKNKADPDDDLGFDWPEPMRKRPLGSKTFFRNLEAAMNEHFDDVRLTRPYFDGKLATAFYFRGLALKL
jgi:hypothetical protein